MKIKEKVLKEVVDKVIHLKSRNEIIPKVIDLTLAEVGKVIDDWGNNIKKNALQTRTDREMFDEDIKELKQKLGIEVLK